MGEKTAVRTREKWVDDVKVIACILVVLGHFFQSMTKANILPENNLYGWFNTTIYYFHVPLFFICSGYLYQKYGNDMRIAVYDFEWGGIYGGNQRQRKLFHNGIVGVRSCYPDGGRL